MYRHSKLYSIISYILNSQIIISEDDLISEKRHMFVLKMYY